MELPKKFTRIAVAAVLMGSVAACGDDDDNNIIGIDPGEAVLSGTTSQDRTLFSDTVYTISGQVTVANGVTLRIQPGTTILGDADVTRSFLLIAQGGTIEAVGTPQEPIVFTSSRTPGTRARGDWGGVVLNGRAPCNLASSLGGTCNAEGDAGTFGGSDTADDSGTLRYVRIEYVGQVISANNELNGLTLNGVGSGTEIDYVQIHFGLDDGIELFGGNVNIKNAIITGAEDDSFDYSTGWRGKGQFWIVQQDPQIADKGFEVDNAEGVFESTPLTEPQIYNVTIVGKGPGGNTSSEVSSAGLHLRRGAAGKIFNAIVLGFEHGLDVDDAATVARCEAGTLVVSNTIFGDIAQSLFADADDDFEETCTSQPAWENVGLVTGQVLTDPYDINDPDFQPVAISPAMTEPVASPPADGFFSAVDYLGAVAPTGTPWYEGWTTFAQI